jgi:hypothetical protein
LVAKENIRTQGEDLPGGNLYDEHHSLYRSPNTIRVIMMKRCKRQTVKVRKCMNDTKQEAYTEW